MENNKTLWSALSRAQGKITEPKLDKTNPHFKSKYASLASIWEAARGPLSSEGLSIIQGLETSAEGKLVLATQLSHESGDKVIFYCPILTQTNDMQKLGCAITYARRYSLNSMLGTSGEDDDDGNAAAGKDTGGDKRDAGKPQDTKQLPVQTGKQSTQSTPNTSMATGPSEAPPEVSTQTIEKSEQERLKQIVKDAGWPIQVWRDWLWEKHKLKFSYQIPKSEYMAIVRWVSGNPYVKEPSPWDGSARLL